MIHRKCLIVDNEDQEESIRKIERVGKEYGIDIDCQQMNIGSTDYTDVLTGGVIDINKVFQQYKKRYSGEIFHLIVFDYDLDDESINGFNLIRRLIGNQMTVESPKMIISGLLQDVISDVIDDKKKVTHRLSRLLQMKLVGFHDRSNYDEIVINFFRNSVVDANLVILDQLKKFHHLRFRSLMHDDRINGATFGEVAELIERDPTFASEFNREIVEQVISYLSNIAGYE